MQNLVTRFHILLFSVTVAIGAVGVLRIPQDFAFPAHWTGSVADWLWPRDVALATGPVLQIVLMAAFFMLGRALTKNHWAKVQHILDPALTFMLAAIAAVQLGLLFAGIGSDLDLVRFAAVCFGACFVILGVVLFEAQRHTYAGLRMPWSIRSDAAWRLVHRVTGAFVGLCGVGLLGLAWFDVGTGPLVIALAAAFVATPVLAAAATLAFDRGRNE